MVAGGANCYPGGGLQCGAWKLVDAVQARLKVNCSTLGSKHFQ